MSTNNRTPDQLRALFAKRDENVAAPPLHEVWHRAQLEVEARRTRRAWPWRIAAVTGAVVAVAAIAVFLFSSGDRGPSGVSSRQPLAVHEPPAAPRIEAVPAFNDDWGDALDFGLTTPSDTTYAWLDLGSASYGVADLEVEGPTDFLLDWDVPAWAEEKRSTL